MKPTKSIFFLLSLFFISNCGEKVRIEITERYEIDSGQRDTHYERGYLRLKEPFKSQNAFPTGTLYVMYWYWDWTAGDYGSVNSYFGTDYATGVNVTKNELFSFSLSIYTQTCNINIIKTYP